MRTDGIIPVRGRFSHSSEVEKEEEEMARGYDEFRALASQALHHLQTPMTAARPSSLRSVPSGFPIIMVKTQKKAAVQASKRMAILKNGESSRTTMDMPTE
jgi:hypothetical protein